MRLNMREVMNTKRLFSGKGQQRNYQEEPRMLRVRFATEERVNIVAEASPNIQAVNDDITRGVRIFRDKMIAEREEWSRLIEQAVRKNQEEEESDKYKWIVDYNKNIDIRVP